MQGGILETAVVRPIQWEKNRGMSGGCTTCTGMYWNGAGTGMGLIQAARSQTPRARKWGISVCNAAGVGTTMLSTCVPRIGTATVRLPRTATLVSALRGPVSKVDMRTVYYGKSHEEIAEKGVYAIAEGLKGNNAAEKESLLLCLDKYLDPWFGYKLPYANEIFELLEYVVINANTIPVKEEALHL